MTKEQRHRRAYKQALRFHRKGLTGEHADKKAGLMMHKARNTNNRRRFKKYNNRWWLLCYAEFILTTELI